MKKSLHFFLSLVALMLMAVTVNAQGLAEGKYYLKNAESGRYWGAGNDWGTRASLLKNPEYVTLIGNGDGTYKMESQVSNGGTNHYFAGDYMDGAPVSLTITASGDYYTIANGTNYYGYDGSSTILGKNLAADSPNALWEIKSEEEMIASLANATKENPADATFLILDPNFGRNNRYGKSLSNGTDFTKLADLEPAWTFDASNKNCSGDVTNGCVESFHATFTMSQTTISVPKGVYKLTAQGFYRQDGSDNENLPYFYINDKKSTFPLKTGSENSMYDASVSFTNGLYAADPIYVELTTDGTLTVGAKLENNTALWCIWDNFELTYYGPEASLADILFAEKIAQVATLRTQATELKGNADVLAPVVTELEEALNASESIETTEEAYNTAIATLQTAIDHAQAYVNAKAYFGKMASVLDNTNVYTKEAYDAVYGTWLAEYNAGTLSQETAATLNAAKAFSNGWHSANNIDDVLLSAWAIGGEQAYEYNKALYINTWSVEGDNDGTNFKVPFFEYWTDDPNSLGAKTIAATLEGVPAGHYIVKAWVRARAKNGTAAADATGITLSANGGEAVDVTEGEAVGTSQFNIGEYAANATVAEDGKLTITFNVADDNNISWLSFKNVKYIDIETYLAELIAKVATLRTQATELKENEDVHASAVQTLDQALNSTTEIEATEEAYNTAIATLQTAIDHAQASVVAKPILPAMKAEIDKTNVYTAKAYETYYGKWITKYENGTLTLAEAQALQDPSKGTGWHAANNIDDVLLSAWTIGGEQAANYDKALYINTWSVEGNNDGTNFKVPFFEYWTAEANSLGANTIAATLEGVPAGDYAVKAWVRVRYKNGIESAAEATGITLQVNDGEAVDVTEGEQVGTSQFLLAEYTAYGEVGEDGTLKINFNVAAENNISWLSFKNVTYEAVPALTLNEEGDDNIATLEEYNGKKANVTLTRTLKTGSYNTFAVPFNIDAIPTGWTVKKLTSSSLNAEGLLSLEFESATSIEAGKPYLVKVASEVADPTFEGVTISSTTTPTKTDAVDFIPTVGKTTLSADENDPENFLFIGEGNKLYNPSELPQNMKGFRAYFYVKNIGTESAKVRAFNLDFGDGETTGIIELRSEEAGANGEGFYDLMGRSIQGQPTQKGVYIKNGKKVIVK